MSDKGETIDFGAPAAFGAHVFRVEIPAPRIAEVRIVEDYGYCGNEAGIPLCDFQSQFLTEVFEIVPRCEVCLAKGHRHRRIRRKLLEHVLKQLGQELGLEIAQGNVEQ